MKQAASGRIGHVSGYLAVLGLVLITCFPAQPAWPSSRKDHEPLPQHWHDSLMLEELFALAFRYSDELDDVKGSDSICRYALNIAERSGDTSLILLACFRLVESNDPTEDPELAMQCAERALAISQARHNLELEARAWDNMARVYLLNNDCDGGFGATARLLKIYLEMKDPRWRIRAYLDLGRSFACKNQTLNAFNAYFTAADQAETLQDTALLISCYADLSQFFNIAKLFDKAKDYRTKQMSLILAQRPIDSLALMWCKREMSVIQGREFKGHGDAATMLGIINYAIRHHNVRLKNWEFAVYRQVLLDSDKFDTLYLLYNTLYPAELIEMQRANPVMYNRLKAFFCEIEGRSDSAEYYFQKSAELIARDPNIINRSNFHRRYGQFLIREGRDREAMQQFILAYNLADSSLYNGKFDYMLNAARELQALYSRSGDYHNAYEFALRVNEVTDSIASISSKDQLIRQSISVVVTQRERKMELEQQKSDETIRQQRTQRNMMAAGIVSMVILSYLIYRNYRNQKRSNRLLDIAKKKSDHLLLNILPYETAEELKLTGSAKAKRYDEVTVMFTDFKDFTQASERMTPEELVGIINSYFCEFDKIMARLGIEKIKIIGDSYMCAGGLPVPNDTHAADVVNAALELQAFMFSERETRIKKGEFYFELRIGIHTGPVIAGIVGLRKFAYDIWGDTVNTASRMENSGEVNRVNISGSTYERVKDLFRCSYRGKILAKNKGEVDMYFVESLKEEEITAPEPAISAHPGG